MAAKAAGGIRAPEAAVATAGKAVVALVHILVTPVARVAEAAASLARVAE